MTETKPRVFISFDYDNDKVLKDFLVGQSKNTDSPFSDWSMKEEAPEEYWEKEAERRISRSDLVIVMVGPKTHNAPGVLKEVRITRKLEKQIYQIIGYKDGNYKPVSDAGRLYNWNWKNLKKLFSK
uniref:Thoeris protein ThsB TIR-like domain-containing protein n=1 Tax=Candidatus Methanophaga sp. ANME-1 ERB7 TaxID=2759913 RepID=A0A7G9Z738_9EURY|nr:hypothetical protein GIJIEOGM_00013 [Methanosarcinales archaeon ANME-1 ERB7]